MSKVRCHIGDGCQVLRSVRHPLPTMAGPDQTLDTAGLTTSKRAASRECGNCGAAYEVGQRFCSNCANRIEASKPEPVRFCQNCNSPLSPAGPGCTPNSSLVPHIIANLFRYLAKRERVRQFRVGVTVVTGRPARAGTKIPAFSPDAVRCSSKAFTFASMSDSLSDFYIPRKPDFPRARGPSRVDSAARSLRRLHHRQQRNARTCSASNPSSTTALRPFLSRISIRES